MTWDWDLDRKGVHQGHYFQENYADAKRDFITRSGLVQKGALFDPRQLLVIRNALEFAVTENENLMCGEIQEAADIMTQIEDMFMQEAPSFQKQDTPDQGGMTMT